MNEISTNIELWFLRHGKTAFNYENCNYDEFIRMLCNGQKTPLVEDHEIDIKSLPPQIDLIVYSPTTRAKETANVLRKTCYVDRMEELELLSEVKFDRDVILRNEYKSLKLNRKDILERWYDGRNRTERFVDSLARVKQIESFLRGRQEKRVVLITHGWLLRILEIYFVQGKHTNINLQDILEVKPIPLGHCIKATLECKNVKSRNLIELVF